MMQQENGMLHLWFFASFAFLHNDTASDLVGSQNLKMWSAIILPSENSISFVGDHDKSKVEMKQTTER